MKPSLQYVMTTELGLQSLFEVRAVQREILLIGRNRTHVYDMVEALREARHTYLMEDFVVEQILRLERQGYVSVA